MNVNATSNLNTLISGGIQNQQQPAPKPAAAATVAPAARGSDADGDNDASRVGTQINVKA
jgi:hypothetical protein